MNWTLYHCKACGVPLGVLTRVKARTMLMYGGDFRSSIKEPCPFCGKLVGFRATTKTVAEMLPSDRVAAQLQINVILRTVEPLTISQEQQGKLTAAVRRLAKRQRWEVSFVRAENNWLLASLLVDPYHAPHTAVSFVMIETQLAYEAAGGKSLNGRLWNSRYVVNAGDDVEGLLKLRTAV